MIGQVDGEIVWGAPQWMLPASLIAGALAMVVLWGYTRPLCVVECSCLCRDTEIGGNFTARILFAGADAQRNTAPTSGEYFTPVG